MDKYCYLYTLFLTCFKACQSDLKNRYIKDKKDLLSEQDMIPLGRNHTNCAVYSNINFNVEICSALGYSIVIPRFIHFR